MKLLPAWTSACRCKFILFESTFLHTVALEGCALQLFRTRMIVQFGQTLEEPAAVGALVRMRVLAIMFAEFSRTVELVHTHPAFYASIPRQFGTRDTVQSVLKQVICSPKLLPTELASKLIGMLDEVPPQGLFLPQNLPALGTFEVTLPCCHDRTLFYEFSNAVVYPELHLGSKITLTNIRNCSRPRNATDDGC